MDGRAGTDPSRLLARWLDGRAPVLIGEGMEGSVHALDDGRVAKVWHAGSAAAARRAAGFQAALGALPLPFDVPRTEEVAVVDGRVVTIERRLGGTSLAAVPHGPGRTARVADALVDVLAALAAAGPLPQARGLSVLDETEPLHRGAERFPEALAALVVRRAARSRAVLGPAVDRLDDLVDALVRRLPEVDSGARAVVHGDLVPANVLVDATDGGVSAVLDWGFLTTEGDPVLDAAVTAAVLDMYGPDARAIEEAVLDRIVRRLGHDREAMLVHRAAYCVVTATAYDPSGRDGHFAWCVEGLSRPEVVDALLRS